MSEINDIHKPLIAWLRKTGLPYIYHRPDVRSGINGGHPDFTVVWQGKVAMIEGKYGKGRLSDAQVDRLEELRRAGCIVCVAYDIETAIRHVETVFGLNARHSDPGARTGQFREGGDAICQQQQSNVLDAGTAEGSKTSTNLGAMLESNGAGQSNPEPAPTDTGPCFGYPEGSFQPIETRWWINWNGNPFVVERNPAGHLGLLRAAKPEDKLKYRKLPDEAISQ